MTVHQVLVQDLTRALEAAQHSRYQDVLILLARAEYAAALAVVRPGMEVPNEQILHP